ncbi:hypothetical protein BVH03_17870 [Pseudomonas sp. PA15(2017)]|uniref:hypothetical protein n=1 Tax=Pseudomonas sp. PA15(2017) TaxID=1932111 RepID=UPI0009597B03|nr:hypothetical protein [Pseudomonas sp. PA15(2017)]OLU25517.1 hypothetical protein BVH03_17870 [Pseudomonas sp. PA15(2017)]
MIEQRMVRQAGENGRWMALGFLLFKIAFVVGLLLAVVYVTYLALPLLGLAVVVLSGLGGGSDEDGYMHGPSGYGYYMGGMRVGRLDDED